MTFAFAENYSTEQLCLLFNTAFSDYVVPMVLTEPVLAMKLTRDGTTLSASPLALVEEKPVGFILNSLGFWQGKKTAYNGGTGVVPTARGQALTRQLYQWSLPFLKAQGMQQCLLEVIQENERALAVYRELGFETTRTFRCFKQAATGEISWHPHVPQDVVFTQVTLPDWPLYQTFWDVEPSWQHHTASIDRSQEFTQILEAQVNGHCVGYGIVYPMTGSIAHLAVAPAWRGKGIGQALLQELVQRATVPTVSVINVDDSGNTVLTFLENRKLGEIPGQYEMVWEV
ncbi:GNAT family N-acetyltransferase [Rufibacter sp. LB8]|uniref:GNAT family N-acetyltransferase n=1 Tax=Rufibacter sp. LB8 TaxID=2777781 RepID=UPI00178C40DB|nr:GNAT family N-acetyltransferase [Rufibacter sp. LB8]